jgi:hypothetical protein
MSDFKKHILNLLGHERMALRIGSNTVMNLLTPSSQ